ncbi:MAG: hypothetical protein J5753_00890 [Oscillospiraceae bacterium]|nr:hypothetical protein [Oscillospiraceae bacterium]
MLSHFARYTPLIAASLMLLLPTEMKRGARGGQHPPAFLTAGIDPARSRLSSGCRPPRMLQKNRKNLKFPDFFQKRYSIFAEYLL